MTGRHSKKSKKIEKSDKTGMAWSWLPKIRPLWMLRSFSIMGAGRQVNVLNQPLKKITVFSLEETLGCRGSVRTLNEEIMDHGQSREAKVADSVKAPVISGQMSIAALHTRTGPLEQPGTLTSFFFKVSNLAVIQVCKRAGTLVKRVKKGGSLFCYSLAPLVPLLPPSNIEKVEAWDHRRQKLLPE